MTDIVNNLPAGKLATFCGEMVEFCLQNFFHKRTREAIHEIVLELDELHENTWGETSVEFEDTRPRDFKIAIADGGWKRAETEHHIREEIMKVVAHEMIHVRQYASKQLTSVIRMGSSGKIKLETRWKNQIYRQKKGKHSYWFEPWEMEARAFEEPAYQMFLESIGKRANYFPM